jgi:hypothetical protein
VDAVAEFRAASEANDLDRFVETLAPDAELARGVMIAEARIGPFAIDDAMVFELDHLARPALRLIGVGRGAGQHPGGEGGPYFPDFFGAFLAGFLAVKVLVEITGVPPVGV